MGRSAIVETSALVKEYGDAVALAGIDFSGDLFYRRAVVVRVAAIAASLWIATIRLRHREV